MEEPHGSGDEGDPYPFLSDRGAPPPGSIYDIMGGQLELGLGTAGIGGSGGRGGGKTRPAHKVCVVAESDVCPNFEYSSSSSICSSNCFAIHVYSDLMLLLSAVQPRSSSTADPEVAVLPNSSHLARPLW